jgi:NADH:ubiquinone oxidoreductase subunit E
MHKNTIEKIKNRYEKRNQIIDFLKHAQEKRDELDPIKDSDQIRHINMKLDMASATLINELDSMLDEVESQL